MRHTTLLEDRSEADRIALLAMAVYVIIDIEFPRLGLIGVDAFDQALVDLRASTQ